MRQLLPFNATPLEAAIEAVGAARHPLPVDLVAAVWSPDDCPAPLLPFLAWGLSVDLWDDDWPETLKRETCRKALLLHRLKTTPAGLRAHVELVGAKVKRLIRPPGRASLRGAMGEAERLAWLERLPQLRIYPFFTRAVAVSRHFATGPGARRQFHGRLWLRESRGFSIYGRRATFYDRGEERPIAIDSLELGEVDRLRIERDAGPRLWHGRGFADVGHLTASSGAERLVTVRRSAEAQSFAVGRGVEPVDVRPQRIAQGRIAPSRRSFFGRTAGFLRSSHAPLLIYDRIALHAADRIGARRKVRGWHGRGRLGIPAFTAEVRIDVPMRRPRRRSGRWHGVGHRAAPDMAPLRRAIAAVRASKAFRDTILIDPATHGPVTFGAGLRFGDFEFGQIREVA